jgi:hypothetical protein
LILITLTVGLNPRLKSKAAKRQGHTIVISRKNWVMTSLTAGLPPPFFP